MDCMERVFKMYGQRSLIKVNLDNILHNYSIIKHQLAKHTEVIAVVKSNSYGHGSVMVAKVLQDNGCSNFAVATSMEGKELREAGIYGTIQVLGIATRCDIPTLFNHSLIPTVSDTKFLMDWADYNTKQGLRGTPSENKARHTDLTRKVIIELNTGLNRSGFCPTELRENMEFCQANAIPVHSVMTHFSRLWDAGSCRIQLNVFLNSVKHFRKQGVKVHAASSGSIANRIGTDLDFVRPGLSLYGQPCESEGSLALTKALGYKQALSWMAKPTCLKDVAAGNTVGYFGGYICKTSERIAMLPIGYGDGFPRALSGHTCITDQQGSQYNAVGTVAMNSIAVKVKSDTREDEPFNLLKEDLNDVNSCAAWGRKINTNPAEILCRLHWRIPRVFEYKGQIMESMDTETRTEDVLRLAVDNN